MKAIKTAALVIGAAALVATGVGAAAGLALGSTAAAGIFGVASSIGISTGVLEAAALTGAVGLASALAPKPSQSGSQTKWKADPYAGVPYVMGRTLVAGNVAGRRGSGGNNTYEHFVTILSIGPIKSIDTTFMNKTTVAFDPATGRASGTYRDLIWQKAQLGACPEPAALTPGAGTFPGWTAAHKLSGLAATLLTLEYDSKGKNVLTTEPAPASIVKGVFVYDPRQDSTYPGGAGPCRAYDEVTYVWSEDPHLHALTFALGRYQNGKRVAGIGTGSSVPGGTVRGIDVASFVEGANLNETRGWKVGGQVATRPDTPWNSLKAILQAGGATPVLAGGTIVCINRAPRVSLATITRSDIVGRCSFSGTQRRRARINGIVPSYRSEAHDWEMVPAVGVVIPEFIAMDGDERVKETPYPLVQDVHQVSQLAAYDVYDAREAGPGSIPLKPWWLNYRIGDCVTFSPEDGFSIKVMITGSSLEASTGVVTYDVKGETDAKHAAALAVTGTAPAIASFTYDTGVAAPAGTDWTLVGATLSANGASIPALVLTGVTGNGAAEAVVFDYRVYSAGAGDEANWIGGAIEAPTIVRKEITGVTPGTSYEVSVRYRVRGQLGNRLILGPVVAGDLATAGGLQQAIATSFPIGLTITAAADGSITISNHTRRYTDGHADVAVTGATIASGLSPGDFRAIYYDDIGRLGGAVTYGLDPDDIDARVSPTNPGRHYVGYVTIPTAGSPPASGGGASPPGGQCVTTDTPIMMLDGSIKPAGQIAVGDKLWTRHEATLEWGIYPVEAMSIAPAQPVWRAIIGGKVLRATGDHLVFTGTWMAMRDIGTADGVADVVKMSVTSAHTYVSNGVLSHNIKPENSI